MVRCRVSSSLSELIHSDLTLRAFYVFLASHFLKGLIEDLTFVLKLKNISVYYFRLIFVVLSIISISDCNVILTNLVAVDIERKYICAVFCFIESSECFWV